MKTLYRLFFLSIIGIFLFSCSDDDGDGISGTPLQLTASTDTLELLESNENDIALTFSWNKGIDRPAYDTVSYIFRLDLSSGDFTKTSTTPDTIDTFEKSYTTLELNDLLLEKWNIHPGEATILKARVVGKVDGPQFVYPEIATTSLVVKTYQAASKPLYLFGTATDGGENISKAERINEVFNGKTYAWEGNLKAGKFKFLTSQSSLLPSLNKGKDNNSLVERKAESDPDTYFDVDKDGYYAIAIARKTMKIDYKFIEYPNIYLIGDAGTGWDLPGHTHKFTMNPEKPNVFNLDITLKAGTLKLLTAADWSKHTFRPMSDNASIYENEVQGYAGGEDLKWRVNDGDVGNYRIILDLNNMTIDFKQQ